MAKHYKIRATTYILEKNNNAFDNGKSIFIEQHVANVKNIAKSKYVDIILIEYIQNYFTRNIRLKNYCIRKINENRYQHL